MAASFLLRSARSAPKCGDLASRSLPATGATRWTAIPLISQSFGNVARLFSSKPPVTDVDDDTAFHLAIAKQREDLRVTDDIVNSEAKLKALFLKWLPYYDHHFDVEDEISFKQRFEIFKVRACFVNEYNKRGYSSTVGLSQFSDMTREESACHLLKTYPKKANHVIAADACNWWKSMECFTIDQSKIGEFSSNVSDLAPAKQREDLRVTDDIVNSEAKLKDLFLKWLSYNDHHFDVEDERSFKTRFGIFKLKACFVNEYNKRGYSSTIELNQFSDLTKEEERAFLPWMTYPKEANQVIASGIDV